MWRHRRTIAIASSTAASAGGGGAAAGGTEAGRVAAADEEAAGGVHAEASTARVGGGGGVHASEEEEAGGVHAELLTLAVPLPADRANEDARAAQLCVLGALHQLCGVGEFKAALERHPHFFPLLFQLRDSGIGAVSKYADTIAKHWDEDFFGWVWECCAACKRVAESLMLEADARAEGAGGPERYAAPLGTIHSRLHEFLR